MLIKWNSNKFSTLGICKDSESVLFLHLSAGVLWSDPLSLIMADWHLSSPTAYATACQANLALKCYVN